MSKLYYFHQASSIPCIPGTFAGVIVEVDEERNEIIKVSPLGGPAVIECAEQPTPSELNPAPPITTTDQSSSKE